jgi:hypothetical protein
MSTKYYFLSGVYLAFLLLWQLVFFSIIIIWYTNKNTLTPMGALTHRSAHARVPRPSARRPGMSGNFPTQHMSAESPSNIYTNFSEVISEVWEP